jgi:exosortase A-associated hydrolase 1
VEYRETALFFDCGSDELLGVVARPRTGARVGVVVVVGGPQYRVGSHRQFVHLSRALAAAGIPCLRFDYRGMGDSTGAPRTFESIGPDIGAAVGALTKETATERIVLWGLCDGASAAMMYAAGDSRIAGIVAVNPWVRTDATQAAARIRHYYLARVSSRAFWSRLLRGEVAIRQRIRDLVRDTRDAGSVAGDSRPFLQRMHDGWKEFHGPVLFLLSGNDMTAREFEAWIAADRARGQLATAPSCRIRTIEGADHTFSRKEHERCAAGLTIDWIGGAVA